MVDVINRGVVASSAVPKIGFPCNMLKSVMDSIQNSPFDFHLNPPENNTSTVSEIHGSF
jgi:hypothetical protein